MLTCLVIIRMCGWGGQYRGIEMGIGFTHASRRCKIGGICVEPME